MERSKEIYYNVGIGILRYGLVGLLLLWGSFKFFAFEANAITIRDSPLCRDAARTLTLHHLRS